MKTTIDRIVIYKLLEQMQTEVGDERFSGMKLLALETELRKRNVAVRLPGKTVLRECINQFRTERWPQMAPRKLSHWTR